MASDEEKSLTVETWKRLKRLKRLKKGGYADVLVKLLEYLSFAGMPLIPRSSSYITSAYISECSHPACFSSPECS